MSKCTDIKDFCGDYSFDVEYSKDNRFTMFFNSLRNAETVKRCIEVDDNVPNVATAVDFVEVVRCGNCKYFNNQFNICKQLSPRDYVVMNEDDFCSYGERK